MDYTIAVEKARVFLTDQGYSGMEPVYGLTEGSITLISFAWKTGGVTVYPDLIRVGVSADTGKIVRFDALAYLMSHRPREIKGAVVSDADAAREFSPDLTVRYVGQVIIPTPGLYEVQCHEFDCIAPDGQRMMIYSDVATGRARQILLRYDGDNGTLTV